MPKSCADCPICHCKGKDEPWNYSCFATMDDINIDEWDKERYITCPLKSTDEIIAEINQIPLAFTSAFEMKNDALNIINKYCKEQTDGKAYADRSGMDFADTPTLDYGA